MDLYDAGADTDLVVAEGNSPRRGLGNSRIRPISTSRLGQAVPLHLLQSNLPSYFGARLYSSSSSSSPPQSSDEQTAGESETNATTPSPIPTTPDGPEAGFASLRGLFGEPRRSWSPPQASSSLSRETDAVDNAQSNRPEQDINPSNNFVDGDPFEDHPNNLFLKAEKEDAKAQAHEMLSSASATEEHSNAALNTLSAEQPTDRSEAGIVSNATPTKPNSIEPSPGFQIRKHIALKEEWSHRKQVIPSREATVRSQQASKGTKAPKPKPLPSWKVDSDVLKGSPRSNEPVIRSVLSESAGSRRPLQSSTSQAPGNVEPSPYNQEPLALSEVPSSGQDSKLKTDTGLTHLTSTGEAHMVDVGQKESTDRVAVAVGFVHFSNDKPYRLIEQNSNKKGDVLGVARIAGIMAAKRCSDIIPLCHPIPITKITLDVRTITAQEAHSIWLTRAGGPTRYGLVAVEARVHTRGQTGVEMEALTAASGACLTVYDMCKAVDKEMVISGARVLYKAGGKSGTYLHEKFNEHPVKEKFLEARWERLNV
jgi:cyclic pyranopterin phosphate synthase